MTMNETIRIIGMLRASAAHNADHNKISEREAFFASANESGKKLRTAAAARKPLSPGIGEPFDVVGVVDPFTPAVALEVLQRQTAIRE